MKQKRFINWMWILISLLPMITTGCSVLRSWTVATQESSTPTPPASIYGVYDCAGEENGLLVGTGRFILRSDGVLVDELSSKTGLWTYHAEKMELNIAGELDVERAVYHPDTGQMEFTLREGLARAHAPEGILRCTRSTQ